VPNGDTERTRLASERTYLAWWRTGIAALAAGFAIGRIVPGVVAGTDWPYIALGAALVVAGLLAILYGLSRWRELDAALREEREPKTAGKVILAMTVIGVAIGIASLLLVLLAP
jgi:inner membrane protein YidH